jgi:F-type H+-transporting ATPase subunit gamma
VQQPIDVPLLPIGELDLPVPGSDAGAMPAAETVDFVFEPGPEAVLSYLLGHYLNIFVYIVMLNAKASEQSARMVSMKSATDSANDMIKELTLHYNKLRQGQITQELLEIAGGQSQ